MRGCGANGGEGICFCFDVTANGAGHTGSSEHYITQEKSMRDPAGFANLVLCCASIKARGGGGGGGGVGGWGGKEKKRGEWGAGGRG